MCNEWLCIFGTFFDESIGTTGRPEHGIDEVKIVPYIISQVSIFSGVYAYPPTAQIRELLVFLVSRSKHKSTVSCSKFLSTTAIPGLYAHVCSYFFNTVAFLFRSLCSLSTISRIRCSDKPFKLDCELYASARRNWWVHEYAATPHLMAHSVWMYGRVSILCADTSALDQLLWPNCNQD